MKSKAILQGLLDIGAIAINIEEPFTWASGIQSPIYCDNRKSIGHYKLRRGIALNLSAIIAEQFPDADIIGGTATAGIPHATSVADELKMPLIYFRSQPKAHGTKSAIEGDYQPGQKVVVVEDLISTGGSVIKCVEYAKEAGLEVLGVVAIFSYELTSSDENFKQVGIPLYTAAKFSELSELLQLNESQQKFLTQWRKDPRDTSIW
ncbi:orotate phosphoribosyltransferase [Culicoidibacter larvae]|uniref:Orotate phosphoribosyltransferase n=1 Tax=Culicoidibacter larvae TaxID=2579976 RepID=A0A5R8QC15_9FIRM|nr:orotate phosphoribosyltransferase [Culicoidibacter larvae]TLG73806.1 orotate phosphoribosyltransferase [Culicoidibacter larvae]